MDVFKIVLLGVMAAILAVTIKSQRPEIALLLSMAAGVLLLLFALEKADDVLTWANGLANRYGLNASYIGIALKITGIALLCEFGVQLCRDAGENAVANKVELGGKICILVLAFPVVEELLSSVSTLLMQ